MSVIKQEFKMTSETKINMIKIKKKFKFNYGLSQMIRKCQKGMLSGG